MRTFSALVSVLQDELPLRLQLNPIFPRISSCDLKNYVNGKLLFINIGPFGLNPWFVATNLLEK